MGQAFLDLQSFVQSLEKSGDLLRVAVPVDANLELAEIHRRVVAADGPALLFENVRGKAFPAVTNLFGTERRVERAFGQEIPRWIESLPDRLDTLMPPKWSTLWRQRDLGWKALKMGKKQVSGGFVKQVKATHPDLTTLPATKSWIDDGGAFLTLPLVHTTPPVSGSGTRKPDNLGIYRVQIYSERETGMHFQIGKGGGFHFAEAEARGLPLATNIYLGGPPALLLSAIAPLPENVPELLLTSLLLERRLRTTTIPESPFPIVADAEFCLAGEVLPHVRRPEGPFGDHYGYYSLIHDYPVFRLKAMYHRRGALFPATVVGKPRQEDFYLGNYLQRLLLPLAKLAMPAVRDLWSYGETGFHSLTAAVLQERYERESLSAAFRVLGEGQLSMTKFLLGTDSPVPLEDFGKTLCHILERTVFERDLHVFSNSAMDSLDYAGPKINHGSKGVLLGLGQPKRILPREFHGSAPSEFVRKLRVFLPGVLVVETEPYAKAPKMVWDVVRHKAFSEWPLIIAVDNIERCCRSMSAFLWTTFTRFDPAADIHGAKTAVGNNRVALSPPILIDARMKPTYPGELFCDRATAAKVTDRWHEYFPGKAPEMGNSDEVSL